MTVDELWDVISPIAHGVANRFGTMYRKHGAEAGDFFNEHYIWVHEHVDMLTEKFEDMEPRHFERFVARCVENESRDYARDIKAQASGYERRDESWYGWREIKTLLSAVFDPDAWLNPPQSEGRTVKAPAEGNNWVTTLADVKAGFQKLDAEDQVLLRAFHEAGLPNKQVADAWKLTESAMSYRHERALKRLSRELGGERPSPERRGDQYDPWRGRRSITTAHARAITDNQYEESA